MDLLVEPAADGTWRVRWPGGQARCALGRGGIKTDKVEGDGATPAGAWPLRRAYYRADRLQPPRTRLPLAPIEPDDGWCDDPAHPAYNTLVKRPFPASHEEMWREDHVYDVVVVLGHNDDPPVPGLGSAVFLHLARPGYEPTAGCVAVELADMLALLAAAGPGDRVVVPDLSAPDDPDEDGDDGDGDD